VSGRDPACKNWVIRFWHGYLSGARWKWLHMVQLMPLPPRRLFFIKSQNVLTFLVQAYTGFPRKDVIKWASVCHMVVILKCCIKLCCSAVYQKLLHVVHQLFTSALDDINDFCQSNSWLSDVWRYCSTWNQSQLAQLKGAPVLDIKVQPVIFHYVFSVLI